MFETKSETLIESNMKCNMKLTNIYWNKYIYTFIYIFFIILVIISYQNTYYINCFTFNIVCIKNRVKSKIIKYSIITKNVIYDTINFHINFILKYNIKSHYYISLDIESFLIMKRYTRNLFINLINISSYYNIDYGSENYGKIVISKTKINKILLTIYKNVLLIDIDIIFFKNPLDYLLNFTEDLTITQDCNSNVNTGL